MYGFMTSSMYFFTNVLSSLPDFEQHIMTLLYFSLNLSTCFCTLGPNVPLASFKHINTFGNSVPAFIDEYCTIYEWVVEFTELTAATVVFSPVFDNVLLGGISRLNPDCSVLMIKRWSMLLRIFHLWVYWKISSRSLVLPFSIEKTEKNVKN